MSCNKNCNCNECEMLSETLITLVDDSNPFCETRFSVEGLKCLKFGNLGKKNNDCKCSNYTNDLIFKSINQGAFNYFNR